MRALTPILFVAALVSCWQTEASGQCQGGGVQTKPQAARLAQLGLTPVSLNTLSATQLAVIRQILTQQ